MKRNKITLLLAAFLLVCGCSDFEEINVNPNNPPTVPANLLLPTVISTAVSSMTGSGNGAAGQFIQHINYIGGSNESFGRFNITGASFREEWNAPMRSVKDINQILDIAEKNNQPQYKALGLICKVYVLSLMTDAYGDIPYNEAYAEYYSADLAEKVVRGQTENILKGRCNGGRGTFGYTLDSERKFHIDPLASPFVVESFRKYRDGLTMKEIRDWLNENGTRCISIFSRF